MFGYDLQQQSDYKIEPIAKNILAANVQMKNCIIVTNNCIFVIPINEICFLLFCSFQLSLSA